VAEKGMESETASSADEQVSGGGGGGGGGASAGADTRGKHRILAELKRVEQEMKFLEVSLKLFFFVLDILNAIDSLHY
jgi:Amt family ammonium transporter